MPGNNSLFKEGHIHKISEARREIQRLKKLGNRPPIPLSVVVKWLENRISSVQPNQKVVGNRKWNGRKVTQDEFDRGDKSAHVCPFVKSSDEKDYLWIGLSSFTDRDEGKIEQYLLNLAQTFVNLDPQFDPIKEQKPAGKDVIEKTIVVAFIDFKLKSKNRTPNAILDGLHTRLKPKFIDKGLMLGQFYAGCPQLGIYVDENNGDKEWYSLTSPYPAFAIRYLAIHDHLFIPQTDTAFPVYRRFFPSDH